MYLDYIQKVKVDTAPADDINALQTARNEMIRAYEFALENIGVSLFSAQIWRDYTQYLKDKQQRAAAKKAKEVRAKQAKELKERQEKLLAQQLPVLLPQRALKCLAGSFWATLGHRRPWSRPRRLNRSMVIVWPP